MPTVTIITATLNRPSLRQACASVEAQTHPDWHHYVLGDGVLPHDFHHPRRTTLGFTRALGAEEPGMNMPEGTPNPILRWALQHLDLDDFVCFLDDDNTHHPAFLERMLAALQANPTTGIALCALQDHRYQRRIPGFPDGRCDNSGFLARRDTVKRISFPRASPTREVLQDCEFIAQCAHAAGWVRVPDVLVDFGIADNYPPGRGKVKWLESWAEPLRLVRHIRQGDAAGAITPLAAAVAHDPLDAWTLWHLGEALLVSGARSQALQRWAEWLELFCRHGIEHDWISYCAELAHAAHGHADQTARHVNQALELLQTRISNEPDNIDNHLNEGLYLLLLGQPLAAHTAYARTLQHPVQQHDLEAARWKLQVLSLAAIGLNGVDHAAQAISQRLDELR